MRRVSHRMSAFHARRISDKASQKTKVRAVISALGFAGNATQDVIFAQASDTQRTAYGDINVKPFSKIQVIHIDVAIYQDGAAVSTDGYVDWYIFKAPGGISVSIGAASVPLSSVPFIFKNGRAVVPMESASGLPSMYHLHGDIRIPPRFQVMNPADQFYIAFVGFAGTGVTYSASGVINYMFKI